MSDKTEAPTPRRRQEARERGEVARSPEVNSGVLLLAAFVLLRAVGPDMGARLAGASEELFTGAGRGMESPEALRTFFLGLGLPLGMGMLPFALPLLLVGLVASVAQVGFLVTTQALMPKWSRINPVSGMKRLCSMRGLVDLLKSVAKIAIICFIAYGVVWGRVDELVALSQTDLGAATASLWLMATDIGIRAGLVMLVIALADFVYQRRQHENNLRMTRQELIEEMKRYENPMIRSRIRQQQRRLAMQRMMDSVPKADVVITNPTHIAVALSYDGKSMKAPKVVAKGQRLTAQRIRELAEEHGVPIVERKPLARALFKMAEVGMEIPADLYQAVAEVLAFVYSLRGDRR